MLGIFAQTSIQILTQGINSKNIIFIKGFDDYNLLKLKLLDTNTGINMKTDFIIVNKFLF